MQTCGATIENRWLTIFKITISSLFWGINNWKHVRLCIQSSICWINVVQQTTSTLDKNTCIRVKTIYALIEVNGINCKGTMTLGNNWGTKVALYLQPLLYKHMGFSPHHIDLWCGFMLVLSLYPIEWLADIFLVKIGAGIVLILIMIETPTKWLYVV